MRVKANRLSVVLLLLASLSPAAATSSGPALSPPPQPDSVVLAQAVHDICPRRVAMLGESTHGDGATVAFKVALVRRLVEQCHFNAVFFEANHYDFLEFDRRLKAGEPTSPAMVSAAVGGLWKFDREFAPLVPYLYDHARAGRLALGGIDNQLGAAGAFYANDTMPEELTGWLVPARRAACRETLHKQIYYGFPHYGAAENAEVSRCLSDITAALGKAEMPAGRRAIYREMLAAMTRFVGYVLADQPGYIRGRDASMYAAFDWLAHRLPSNSKIIVWAATVHVAHDASADPDFGGGGNFGSFVYKAYGRQSFALGTTALSGSYRYSRQEPARPLPPPAADSLEHKALADTTADAAYLGAAKLGTIGTSPGRLFGADPVTANWHRVLDGVIVLREQRPPQRTDGP